MNHPYRFPAQKPDPSGYCRPTFSWWQKVKCFFGYHSSLEEIDRTGKVKGIWGEGMADLCFAEGWTRYRCQCCGLGGSSFRQGFWWDDRGVKQ